MNFPSKSNETRVAKGPSRSRGPERAPGPELLRIVCMLMILTSHFFVHGKVLGSLRTTDVNYSVGWFIEACCYVMVNCFVLITGYYQSASRFKLKKFLLLWGQIDLTSAAVYLALAAFKIIPFVWSGFFTAAAAVTGTRYWFATAYLILYALSPLLNRAMRDLSRREHLYACAALWGLFVVGRNVTYWLDFANLHGGYSYVSFIVLYVTAAYLRKYPPKKRNWLGWYFLLSGVTALSRILMAVLYHRYRFSSDFLKVFMQYNSLPVAAASVCLFLFFLNLDIKGRVPRALIGFFAPLTFGVYIIHEHRDLRDPLWNLLKPWEIARSPKMFLLLIATVLSLFLICALLEFLRRTLSRLFRVPELFARIADGLCSLTRSLLERHLPPEESCTNTTKQE